MKKIIGLLILFLTAMKSKVKKTGARNVKEWKPVVEVVKSIERIDVSTPFILAIIERESSGNPNAVREEPRINDKSIGLMQILVRTARDRGFRGTERELFEPFTNVKFGIRQIEWIRKTVGTNDFARIAAAYNAGVRGESLGRGKSYALSVLNRMQKFI